MSEGKRFTSADWTEEEYAAVLYYTPPALRQKWMKTDWGGDTLPRITITPEEMRASEEHHQRLSILFHGAEAYHLYAKLDERKRQLAMSWMEKNGVEA